MQSWNSAKTGEQIRVRGVDLLEFGNGSWSRRTPIGNHRQVKKRAAVQRKRWAPHLLPNEGQTCIK